MLLIALLAALLISVIVIAVWDTRCNKQHARKESFPTFPATFTPTDTPWYKDGVERTALKQFFGIALFGVLFFVLPHSMQAQTIELPSCDAQGHVVLTWERNVSNNPVTVTGWRNPGTTYQGTRIVFDTGVQAVHAGDVYYTTFNKRTDSKTLPFSWQCPATATPAPTITPTPTRKRVSATYTPAPTHKVWLPVIH